MVQMVKNLPAMQETWVQYLGWEDSLEKGMATHSSILARKIPRTVWSWDTTERLSLSAVCFFSMNDEASCSYTVGLF